jgi:hypothetical protein
MRELLEAGAVRMHSNRIRSGIHTVLELTLRLRKPCPVLLLHYQQLCEISHPASTEVGCDQALPRAW